jgi:hypothetical protein
MPSSTPSAHLTRSRLAVGGAMRPPGRLGLLIAQRMMDRLTWITLTPRPGFIGAPCAGLLAHAALATVFRCELLFVEAQDRKKAAVISKKIAKPWWSQASALALRFERPAPACRHAVGQYVAAPLVVGPGYTLKVDGFVMFSGPDTATRLHGVYALMGWPVAGSDYDRHARPGAACWCEPGLSRSWTWNALR